MIHPTDRALLLVLALTLVPLISLKAIAAWERVQCARAGGQPVQGWFVDECRRCGP